MGWGGVGGVGAVTVCLVLMVMMFVVCALHGKGELMCMRLGVDVNWTECLCVLDRVFM